MARTLCLALLAAGLACPPAAATTAPPAAALPSLGPPKLADFEGKIASADARRVADWVAASGDNQGLPFMIVDKIAARVFLFDDSAQLQGAASALLGLGRGDGTVAGIGQRRLSKISPKERTTPAGRFVASLGNDYTQDILWVDYDAALSLHRVITGNPEDRRRQRLASATPLDNRISYGCINVPVDFYDKLVMPAFADTVGIVYILPETKTLDEIFAMSEWKPAFEPKVHATSTDK
jgi:hypothetical protein